MPIRFRNHATLWLFILFLFPVVLRAGQVSGLAVTSDAGGIRIDYRTPDVQMNRVRFKGESFVRVTFAGSGVELQPGNPELPVRTVLVPITGGMPGMLTVESVQVREQPIKGRLWPSQRPWLKNRKRADRPFDLNREAYEQPGPAAPWASVGQPAVIGGVRVLPVIIRPVRYDPGRSMLRIVTKLELRVTGVQASAVSLPAGPVRQWVKRMTVDVSDRMSRPSVRAKTLDTGSMGRYLVITDPEFVQGLADFVNHKEAMGYSVTVMTTSETGATAAAIKGAIQKAYDDPATRPDFVLLVGDEHRIPAWQGVSANQASETLYTDLFYGLLDGSDHFPDAFVGRFPASTVEGLAHMVSKTIWMEERAAVLDRQGLFVASDDQHQVSETTHEFVKSVFLEPDNWGWTDVYMHDGGTTEDVSVAFNEGRKLAVYSGHGAYTAWWRNVPTSHPFFSTDDVAALQNIEYPYVFTFACITGAFVEGANAGGNGGAPAVCFSEALVSGGNGAVTSWASSVNSYWDQDDVLERAVFRAMTDEGIHRVGPVFVAGLTTLWTYYAGDDYSRAYFEQYNLMGDPGLWMEDYAAPVSRGRIFTSADRIDSSGTVTVEVWDSDLTSEVITIEAIGPDGTSSVSRELYKYSSGKYYGSFSGSGLVPGMAHTGQVLLRYNDASSGSTGPSSVTCGVVVDMDPPALIHMESGDVTLTDATLDLTFSEAADWHVTLREAGGGAAVLEEQGTGVDRVSLTCSGLTADTAYVMDLGLTDAFGHVANLDNVPVFSTPTGEVVVDAPCDTDDGTFSHSDVPDLWGVVADVNARSGGYCWYGRNSDTVADSSLVLQDVTVPVSDRVMLTFWHRYSLESGYDGGVLEISFDGGQSWLDLGASIPTGTGGYTGVIPSNTGYGSPLEGRGVWTGTLGSMTRVSVDLTAWAGDTVSIRWRLGCDSSAAWDGWWIDDVRISGIDGRGSVLTFVGVSPDTVLSLAAGEDTVIAELTPYRSDGTSLSPVELSLSPFTALHQSLSDLLAPMDANGVATVRVTANGWVAGWQMTDRFDERGEFRFWTPAFTGGGQPAVVVPHVANTTWYWTTSVSLFNGSDTLADAWFCFTPGAQLEPGAAVSLSPGETVTVDVESELFGGNFPTEGVFFGSFTGYSGGGLASLAAVESFEKRTVANGASLTLDLGAGTRLIVAHVAENTSYWWTGIALDNLSNTVTAAAQVTGYTSDGTVTATKLYGIRPGHKLMFVAGDEFPSGTAWLDVSCDRPMIGYELFGTFNNNLLAGLGIPPSGATDMFLPVVDVSADWLGLTLVNPNGTEAAVTLTYYLNGGQVGQQLVTLGANQKVVGLVGNPEGTTGNYLYEGDCDLIRVQADRPVVAFCLEGNKNMERVGGVMAAVR